MTRKDFLKTLAGILAGVIISRYRFLLNGKNIIPASRGKEARYYKQADHLAG